MDAGLTAWSAYNAISGKDLLSGAHLSNGARIGYGAGVLLSVAGPLVGKIAGKGLNKLAETPQVSKMLGKLSNGTELLKASKTGQLASKLSGSLKNLGSRLSESGAGKALNKASTAMMKPLNKVNDAYASAAEKIKGLFVKSSKNEAGKSIAKDINVATKGRQFPEKRTLEEGETPFVEGSKKELKPNIRYKTSLKGTNHNYLYETDTQGRIEHVQAEPLELKESGRKYKSHTSATPDKGENDEAGHIIADLFDGDPHLINLVSQDSKVNHFDYRGIEREWQNAIKKGKTVNVDIKINYGKNARPESFIINYSINSVKQRPRIIPNGGK